ncbi:MAG: ATP-dependent zinc protease [Alphaproteobacteria bacterium]
MSSRKTIGPQIAGWREWAALPDFGLTHINAKMDTGAKTSSLHATHIRDFVCDGETWVSFRLAPRQRSTKGAIDCKALVLDERTVKSSSGHEEHRVVIETAIGLGRFMTKVEVTLTDRTDMTFRMLIGRRTMRQFGLMIDTTHSYLLGEPALPKETVR